MGDFKFEVWPTKYRRITQHFGVNRSNYAQFGLPGHDGVDIHAPSGSEVYCVAPGEVFRVHDNPSGHNYGIHVRVAHQDGYKTIYGHLQKVFVRVGQIVDAGTLLGLADSTGNSFGTHLHLGLKQDGVNDGRWPYNLIDPTPFLLPLLGWKEPAGPFINGWVLSDSVIVRDALAQVNIGGATLYINNETSKMIPAGTIMIVEKEKEPFISVRVPLVAIGLKEQTEPIPTPEPPPLIATVEGWAWKRFLTVVGNQAIVGSHGINLREGPERTAANIGMVKAKSTVTILSPGQGPYLPVRVRRNDFIEPVSLPDPPPDPRIIPPKEDYMGWALTQYLSPLGGRQALTSRLGVNLRNRPDKNGQNIGLIKAFATVSLAGPDHQEYSPVLTRREDVLNAVDPMPDIEIPDPWPDGMPAPAPPKPAQDSIPGWAFTNGLNINGRTAKVAQFGSNLRVEPRHDSEKLGFVPPDTDIVVTGPPQGEYTPVRVREDVLESPQVNQDDLDPDTHPLGQVRIGLHASADPDISDSVHQEFAQMRPGIIKVLSFHSAEDIGRLAADHPDAHWIIRAYLSIGDRNISPSQFVNDTFSDVRRAMGQLRGRDVVVELHNEPNTSNEGLGSTWSDGATFGQWWLELLKKYRRVLPNTRFIYPGLSPGTTVTRSKLDHVQFVEASRSAVEAADGLAVHLYWSEFSPLDKALDTLDDYISRFRSKPIWVTEASRMQGGVTPAEMAQEYLRFWRELQSRPVVQGVTYFVASASNEAYADQVWLGKGIAGLIGRR
jgi:hypothetical protein